MSYSAFRAVPFEYLVASAEANSGTPIDDISKYSTFRKFGRSGAITTTVRSIWPAALRWTPASTAQTISFVSDATTDNSSGTGCRSFYVYGTDASGDYQAELVVPTGTTPVVTSNTFSAVNTLAIAAAGSTGWNDGTITGTWTTDSKEAIRMSEDVAGDGNGRSHHCIYTVPNNRAVLLSGARIGSESTKAAEFRLWVYYPDGYRWNLDIADGIQSYIPFPLPVVIAVPAGATLEISARLSSGTGTCSATVVGMELDLS